MPKSLTNQKLPSTQKYLDIAEIKDDCVVLKDGSLRAILLVSSVNFALKSDDEQKAIIGAYVNFLNSLEFPLQIVIQSRKLNVASYIDKLKQAEENQDNDLLKMQTKEYIDYVKELVEMGEIMSKNFFIVIPYSSLAEEGKGFFIRFKETVSAAIIVKLKRTAFERHRSELFKRVNIVNAGLANMGLKAASLDTQSLIELFYNTYNPEISEQEKMEEIGKLRIENL